MIALFHRRAVSHFMSSLVYVSGKGPDVEVGDGLPLLGRGVAHDGALPEVQLSEHRMNFRIAEFCSGGESRKRRSGAGRPEAADGPVGRQELRAPQVRRLRRSGAARQARSTTPSRTSLPKPGQI